MHFTWFANGSWRLVRKLVSSKDFYFLRSPNPATGSSRLTAEMSAVSCRWAGFFFLLIRWQQALSLGMFQYSVVAEVVLLRGLNAEGPLRSHATHRLKYVEGADILEL